MQILELTPDNAREIAREFLEGMRRGDLILFPTDTVYGLGGRAFSRIVLDKLRRVKPDRPTKPTAVLIDGIIRMSQCAGEPPSRKIVALTEAFWPGALTMVWKTSNAIPEEYQTPDRSLGYRAPDSPYLLEAMAELEAPLWATSANLPGAPPPRIYSEINDIVIAACDLVIRTKDLLSGRASTVIDVRGREPQVLREAQITADDILRVWKRA